MALNDPDGENLMSMEVYYSTMAIMARLQTQIWTLDPDPSKDSLAQLLRIGTVSAPLDDPVRHRRCALPVG